MGVTESPLVACHDCDLLQREPMLPEGGVARCRRCGAILSRNHPRSSERALAFGLGALLLFLIANLFPIVGLSLGGDFVQTSLLGAARAMYRHDMRLVAALVLATTFVAPLAQLLALLYLLLPACLGRRPPRARLVFRGLTLVQPWGMLEVFVLGILVSLVKLAHLASVVPGVALWSFGGLMLLMAATSASFDARDLWTRLEAAR
ncbi:PqiA family protein [Azotobacter vinelandii CA]|uniref:PqiA family protein n=2 Tax=Azotobacter vinelandii TaxID=354 RepID=C1DGN2_AZOVD|nr:paraquat-inducible protein A [Azotobacter vinelandii]ACO80528.1 PqiA family protein [Azotobacter vinelandii DJ]AGK14369.1 PqiA family protein [Azotobacter vinelandii CA]AGK21978.1 PqiA family protein [Azotobacter vinelandii CA6]WKN21292.1 paraquat-inducible protein A [Azotobacter vinelandii]SFX36368.1 paraquat-inducible protein A [Azotobacter vinelandii]